MGPVSTCRASSEPLLRTARAPRPRSSCSRCRSKLANFTRWATLLMHVLPTFLIVRALRFRYSARLPSRCERPSSLSPSLSLLTTAGYRKLLRTRGHLCTNIRKNLEIGVHRNGCLRYQSLDPLCYSTLFYSLSQAVSLACKAKSRFAVRSSRAVVGQ